MKREKKEIRYNVRMTKSTFDIVDRFEGDNFTAKFENLVNYCFLEKEKIDDEIKQQQKFLEQLEKQIINRQDIKHSIDMIEHYIDKAKNFVNQQDF